LQEAISSLQAELEKQMSNLNNERQGKAFAESQFKAESRLRAEAEENLSLQNAEFGKQIQSLESQLQNERRKVQILQEKLHILEAKLTYVRTKGMDGQSVDNSVNDVYS